MLDPTATPGASSPWSRRRSPSSTRPTSARRASPSCSGTLTTTTGTRFVPSPHPPRTSAEANFCRVLLLLMPTSAEACLFTRAGLLEEHSSRSTRLYQRIPALLKAYTTRRGPASEAALFARAACGLGGLRGCAQHSTAQAVEVAHEGSHCAGDGVLQALRRTRHGRARLCEWGEGGRAWVG